MKVKVIQPKPPEPEVEKEVLATAIVKASEAMRDLLKSGLNRKAIIVLLAHKTQLYQNAIERVLDALETLKKDYCG